MAPGSNDNKCIYTAKVFEIDVWLRPGVQLLDVTGPAEVFSTATRYCAAMGRPGGYVMRMLGPEVGPVRTAAGLQLVADTPWSAATRRRSPQATLLLPGTLGDARSPLDAPLERALRRWPGRLASVCAASWKLAQAGRLNARRATTHWLFAKKMQATFPQVQVQADALWTEHDGVWTSAGVSAGIDLALAMVQADLGRDVALQVAQLLVLYMKRPGGQSQFSAVLHEQQVNTGPLQALLGWMHEHPEADLRVPALAERAGMSPRNFARVFKQQMGTTPAQKVADIRLQSARRWLEEEPSLALQDVCLRCGYASVESLRRHFRQSLGVTPGGYRARFSASG